MSYIVTLKSKNKEFIKDATAQLELQGAEKINDTSFEIKCASTATDLKKIKSYKSSETNIYHGNMLKV